MKLAAVAAFLALPNANAIYLACCKRENECHADRISIEGAGNASTRVCCYEGETAHATENLDDMMTCFEEIGDGGSAKAAPMSLMLPEETAVAEGATESAGATGSAADEVPMATVLSTTDTAETTAAAEGTAAEDASTAAAATTSAGACCGAPAAAQPQLRSNPEATPGAYVCPNETFAVEGATYAVEGASYQVCCDAEGRAPSEFVDVVLPACGDASVQASVGPDDAADSATEESLGGGATEETSEGDAEAVEEGSNGAGGVGAVAAVGAALVGALVQAAF